jgi:hypothetical protein
VRLFRRGALVDRAGKAALAAAALVAAGITNAGSRYQRWALPKQLLLALAERRLQQPLLLEIRVGQRLLGLYFPPTGVVVATPQQLLAVAVVAN